MKIETALARAGLCTDQATGAISTPIYQTATFSHPALGVSTGYDYSRTVNPTRQVLENTMAELEKGDRGFAFSSGVAAITAVLMTFSPGDHLVVSEDLYGGTYRLFEKNFKPYGIEASYVDTSSEFDLADWVISGKTKAVFLETPSNPLMRVTDLIKIVNESRKLGIQVIVDNTFMTPYLQRPLELGADIVVHSGTKYLGGHNDVLSGIVVTRTKDLGDRVAFIQNSTGAVLGPQDSWLMLRGLKTLALRMVKQQENAYHIAEWLLKQDKVDKVFYPGLEDHSGHFIQAKQASGFGAMLSFTVKDKVLVEKIINRVSILTFAESLGGVETLITYPVKQTHADIPADVRKKIGVTDDLLRISVGIEDITDLIDDLNQAMNHHRLYT